MERDNEKLAAPLRRTSKLWRVLVVGGAVLASACASTKDSTAAGKGGSAAAPASGSTAPTGAEQKPAEKPQDAGGVRGW